MEITDDIARNIHYAKGRRDAQSFKDPAEQMNESNQFMYDLVYADGGGEIPVVLGMVNREQSQAATKQQKKSSSNIMARGHYEH